MVMLHVATVHHRSPRWIDIQQRELRRHISVPFQVWTSLQGIDPSYGDRFDHVIDQAGGHAGKLNNLALEISQEADEDDLLMFLDGDAFPISDPMPVIEEALNRTDLVAVRRAENLGDEQPHPCFCVTTVRTWREVQGDWSMGHRWQTPDGRRPTDVGGNLLRALELAGASWHPLLRTNPVWGDGLQLALYGDVVYHHGAGFRRGGASRAHYDTRPEKLAVPDVPGLRALTGQIDKLRVQFWRARTRGPQLLEAKRVFEMIERDDPSWLEFVLAGGRRPAGPSHPEPAPDEVNPPASSETGRRR